jgi:hypothetical protein
MKTKCLLFIVGIILSTLVYSQNEVCPSNNINTQWRGFATRAFTCLGFQPSFLFIYSNTYLQ